MIFVFSQERLNVFQTSVNLIIRPRRVKQHHLSVDFFHDDYFETISNPRLKLNFEFIVRKSWNFANFEMITHVFDYYFVCCFLVASDHLYCSILILLGKERRQYYRIGHDLALKKKLHTHHTSPSDKKPFVTCIL